ncbi:iron-regulated membrane protein, Iron-uptake factor PiuB [Klebsiella oxytoca]|nr:iron-regulated membrane protein, Iron-uptake factor PiuB [Klebsiella oxytoca]
MRHGAMEKTNVPPRVEDFDEVLQAARKAGLEAGKLEIRPPSASGRAWTVNEIDRSWPTQVDAVAIDGFKYAGRGPHSFFRLSAYG